MKTKAQGLPITVIVIAALCLAILVILLYATTGKLKFFGTGVSEETKVKECVPPVGNITLITQCSNPVLGSYGQKNTTGQVNPLPPHLVCCQI